MVYKFICRDELATYDDSTKEIKFSSDLDRTLIYESREDSKKFIEWLLNCERCKSGAYYTCGNVQTFYVPYEVIL